MYRRQPKEGGRGHVRRMPVPPEELPGPILLICRQTPQPPDWHGARFVERRRPLVDRLPRRPRDAIARAPHKTQTRIHPRTRRIDARLRQAAPVGIDDTHVATVRDHGQRLVQLEPMDVLDDAVVPRRQRPVGIGTALLLDDLVPVMPHPRHVVDAPAPLLVLHSRAHTLIPARAHAGGSAPFRSIVITRRPIASYRYSSQMPTGTSPGN